MCNNKWLSYVLLLIMIPTTGFAGEVIDSYRGVRPAGMGNAFVGVANDFNTIFYNPAGILRLRKARTKTIVHRAEFANIFGEVTKNSLDLNKQLDAVEKVDVTAIQDKLENIDNKLLYARAGFFPYISMFNFQLGFLADTQARATMEDRTTKTSDAVGGSLTTEIGGLPIGTKLTQAQVDGIVASGETNVDISKMHLNMVINLVPTLGFALGMLQDRLSFGVTMRYVMRTELKDYFAPRMIADGTIKSKLNSYVAKGAGFGVDVGFLYYVSDFWFPQFGFSVRNVGGTVLASSKKGVNAETGLTKKVTGDAQSINFGFSIMPRFSRNTAVRLATDIHRITDNIDYRKKMHFGAELIFGNPLVGTGFTLRGGYNQTLWTAGITLDTGFLAIEFASYGEEVGSSNLIVVEDRRYIGRLSVYL